jgi:hypothetical protein
MTLYRLYRLHRSGGRPRLLALSLAWRSIHLDRAIEREIRSARRRAAVPFVDSR